MMQSWPILFVVACSVLAYTGFCRLVHSDLTTRIAVRASIWLLTVVAGGAAAFVIGGLYRPDVVATSLVGAMGIVQVVTSRVWAKGVPASFQRQAPATQIHDEHTQEGRA